jgi:opacity protein-like surface antigen
MKKFILSALMIVMIAGAADAQRFYKSPRGQQGRASTRQVRMQPSDMKGRLYNQLNMSSYQRAQSDRLNQNLASGLQSMRYNNRLSKQQRKNAVSNMVQQHQSGFRSILSPSQSQQYSSMLNSGGFSQLPNNGLNLDLGDEIPGGDVQGTNSVLGEYGWLVNLLGSNLNLGSLLGGNFDLGSLLGLFTR